MDKTQTEALIKWSTTMVETVQDISKGLEELSEVVFKHAQMNLDSRQQITNLIVQLGEATDVLTKEEVKKLKEI